MKFVDTLTRLQVDISLGPANGIQSAETVRSMVRTQPALRPLAMAIKHFLALRNLNEVFTGGMGGYAIVCMVMGFLQVSVRVEGDGFEIDGAESGHCRHILLLQTQG